MVMLATLHRVYTFEAAHFLPDVPADHKCGTMHGHSFELVVSVCGSCDNKMGWVCDFAEIDRVVKPWVAALDHNTLNTVQGLETPTSEMIAAWFWANTRHGINAIPGATLHFVEVSESPRSRVVYRGGL